MTLILTGGIFLILFIFNGRQPPEARGKPDSSPLVRPETLPELEAGPFQRMADQRIALRKITDHVQKGETIGHVLERLGLSTAETHVAARAVGEVMDLTRVRPGLEISLFLEKETGRPVHLELSRGAGKRLIALKTPAGYSAAWQKSEPVLCLAALQGRIKASFWGSAVKLYGLDPELVMTFADIFAYDIDFFTDIKQGDSFRLLYEKKYIEGSYSGPGRILAAEFVNNGRKVEAYYYESAKGEGGYYNAEGRSLKKMFLKSPLRFRRISSYFSRSRFHPILKIYRPHLGIDYAAPLGTPVEALGDGRVIFAGWKGGYGKYIVIKHNMNYKTCYAHLSRFAKGLKKGCLVRQGDLIGHVGSTGLSTGPHLDFRVKRNNKFINPLSLKLKPAPPIDPAERPDFLAQAEKRRAEYAGLLTARR
ncbi:MAG: peptidoglycan DD-metalloendopeptidase family protein [Thermodesulfobacteriota bacterium]|nr:peptidoglycan DD-metalloendopeptidase family protein [Thermodesulfobacteriota bacterium]